MRYEKNLVDVIQAAEEIRNFTRQMDLKAYHESPLTQRAVERDFEIIGEALNRIKKIDEEILKRVSEYQRIIGFRNVLIHGYDLIDDMNFRGLRKSLNTPSVRARMHPTRS
jgi:uncharacterized protein with HEPN domain